MARMAMVVAAAALAGLLAGCEMEPTQTVHRSSIDEQFGQLNKGGWSVTTADSREKRAAERPKDMRVVREADFGNLQVRTNFQIDDPKLRAEQEKREREEALKRGPAPQDPAPAATPFGTMMPGR